MLTMKANPKLPGDWKERHNGAVAAMINPPLTGHTLTPVHRPFEYPVAAMLHAWAEYADDHRTAYESAIGDDGVLGPEWQAIGLGIRGLLNGETGPRLDCGTLDGFILDTLAANGIDTETL